MTQMHPFFSAFGALGAFSDVRAAPASAGTSHDAKPHGTIAPLPELGLLMFTGADAVSFLQSQTTNDMATATDECARLAGYCTAQGRLLSSAVFWQGTPAPDAALTVLGMLRRDVLASTQQRLSMFVLRAKVKIQPAEALSVAGVTLAKDSLNALEQQLGHALPDQTWGVTQQPTGTWIAAPGEDHSVLRFWWVAGPDKSHAIAACELNLAHVTPESWQASDIRAGLPWISVLTRDLFIPQTINLDLIQGVSFTKGCYPGQEVVARSHYRGTLKKRMALGWCKSETVALASDIVEMSNPDQPCGRVINQSWDGQRQWLLFECSFDAQDRGGLCLAGKAEDPIHLQPLPYPVPRPGQSL